MSPEMLAAVLARYSRSEEGIDNILRKVTGLPEDKAIDQIFQYTDYGHSSILQMCPIALCMEGISMVLAQFIWQTCPLATGQERSTRYVRNHVVIPADQLGIPYQSRTEWNLLMDELMGRYRDAVSFWTPLADQHFAQHPIQDCKVDSPKYKRLVRNYALDRARYLLPQACSTNVGIVQSGQEWARLIRELLSHPAHEFLDLGEQLKAALTLVAPRCARHAKASEASSRVYQAESLELEGFARVVRTFSTALLHPTEEQSIFLTTQLDQLTPNQQLEIVREISSRANRYDRSGPHTENQSTTWRGCFTFAEIRDFARHRVGRRNITRCPGGFYAPIDQLDFVQVSSKRREQEAELLEIYQSVMARSVEKELQAVETHEPTAPYWGCLGTLYGWQHTTFLDNLVYMIALRTGAGGHYRYVEVFREIARQLQAELPKLTGHLMIGSGEPE